MRSALLLAAAAVLTAQAPPAFQPTAFERAVVAEMSLARTEPWVYARALKAQRGHYEGLLWKRPGRTPLRTEEGLKAHDEAIAFLERAKPIGPLKFNEGLAEAARRHAEDLAARGAIEHRGGDGSTPAQRLERLGTWHGAIAEVIGTLEEDARDLVIQLILDDGVAGRGHRLTIFNPRLHQAGAGSAPHSVDKVVTVVDFADGFLRHP